MSANKITLRLMRVDPIKYALVSAILGFLIAIILLLVFVIIAMIDSDPVMALVLEDSIIKIILAPFVFALVNFILVLIITALLNFILKKSNGLDLDFDKIGLGINEIGVNRD